MHVVVIKKFKYLIIQVVYQFVEMKHHQTTVKELAQVCSFTSYSVCLLNCWRNFIQVVAQEIKYKFLEFFGLIMTIPIQVKLSFICIFVLF